MGDEAPLFPEISHPKKRMFLAAYSECALITKAAEIADIERRSHNNWLKSDPQYREAFERAKELACQALEQEAIRRAMHGVDEPVFYQGEQCGTVKKYSDTLLIFALKGAMPEKYRDRWDGQISGPSGGPIQLNATVEAKQLLEDRVARVVVRLGAQAVLPGTE